MKANRSIFMSLAVSVLLTGGLCSCSTDERLSWPDNMGTEVSLIFSSDPMRPYKVTTKALDIVPDPKEEEEKRINSLHIFFFTPDGQYLTGGYLQGYRDDNAPESGGYFSPSYNSSVYKISRTDQSGNSLFDKPDAASNARVYAVANINPALFQEKDGNGRPKVLSDMAASEGISPMEALEKIIARPSQSITTAIPAEGMPMAGKKTVNLTAAGGTSTDDGTVDERTISLKALMARVDVSIDLRSETDEGRLPSFQLTAYSVHNMPEGSLIGEPAEGEFTGDFGTGEGQNGITLTEHSVPFQRVIYNNNEQSIDFTFYVFENRQEAEWTKDAGEKWADGTIPDGTTVSELDGKLYPSGMDENRRQRYKPYIADKANATCLELHGFYTTYNGFTYEIAYTLYLGANHTDDFTLKRNHQYITNITIKGIEARDDNSGEYTLDARVNVDEQTNNFYLSILRERNHDAHFCVTPMDVYMFHMPDNDDPDAPRPWIEVTLDETSIDPKTGLPWIRMEKIPATDMATGTLTQASGGLVSYDTHSSSGGAPFKAGHGKRKYFTTKLVTETLKEGDGIHYGKKVIIDQTRDRIYFYIDENLSDSQDRTATVHIAYYDSQDDTEPSQTRTLDITQVHLLKVQVYGRPKNENRRDESNPYPEYGEYNKTGGIIYMEQFEEYLDHYDPLDEYQTTQMYEGLPWAEDNFGIDVGSDLIGTKYCCYDEINDRAGDWIEDPGQNYIDGMPYTGLLMNHSDFSPYFYNERDMTLNDYARTAFGYCYNKNKRDENNEIPFDIENLRSSNWLNHTRYKTIINQGKWFLPGIRQMEDALYTYYGMFPEFQGNFYWSSSASKTNDPSRARATKVGPDGNYVVSGDYDYYEQGRGGHAKRSEILRIRAFRIDLKPCEY